jgi:hypothetical protein
MSFLESTQEQIITAKTKAAGEQVFIYWRECVNVERLDGGEVLGRWVEADVNYFTARGTKEEHKFSASTLDGLLTLTEGILGDLDYATAQR